MSCTEEFIEFVRTQIDGTGAVRSRKMFGEYMIYVNDKPLFMVCDNTVFVKQLPAVETLLADAEKGFPYQGAKEHYVLDIDNKELATRVVATLLPIIAVPKPKKKKVKT